MYLLSRTDETRNGRSHAGFRRYGGSLWMAMGLLACVACSPAPGARTSTKEQDASAAAVTTAGEQEPGIDALFKEFTQAGSPGAAVGVYHQGRLVFAKGYGLADVEAGTSIKPDTPFHVASVSKQFAAFSIALLARDGKVDLDEDVRTYLPYMPDFGHKITVRHLISHTSGLRDQYSLFQIGGHGLDDRLRQVQIVNMVSRQRGLNFTPGTRYSYNNTGYTLLGEIVHAVSGQTLREFTTERIFQPLGMHHTFFFDDVEEIVPGRANSYARQGEGKPWRRVLMNVDNVGATSLFTTVEDLAKWAGNFNHPKVGDKALIEQVTARGALDDGTLMDYGFGLERRQIGGREVVAHPGSEAGFRSIFVNYPDEDFAVVIAANTSIDLTSKVEAIADLYLPRPAISEPAPEPAPPPEDPDADAASLAGLYLRTDVDSPPLQLQLEGGNLHRTSRSGKRENAVLRQGGSFDFGKPALESFNPVRDVQGRVVALERHEQGSDKVTNYARGEASRLDASGLAPYAGRYRSQELDVTYEVMVQDGALALASLWMPKPVKLEQVVRDRFDSGMWWFGVVLFQRDATDGVRSLTFGGRNGILLERVE